MPDAAPRLFPALAPLPLLLAYVVAPVLRAVAALIPAASAVADPAELLARDLAGTLLGGMWLGLAGLALACALAAPGGHGPETGGRRFWRRAPAAAAAVLLAGWALATWWPRVLSLAPVPPAALAELAPVAFLLFALAWARTFGLPSRRWFVAMGGVLALLTLADLGLSHLRSMASMLPYGEGLLGEPELPALLLLVSLCASLRPADEPAAGDPVSRLLIPLGLAATGSPPALFAAAWVLLFFGPRRLGHRLLLSGALLAVLALALAWPAALWPWDWRGGYWLRMLGISLLADHPGALLTGFPFSAPLPHASGSLTALLPQPLLDARLYPVNFPSCWVRMTLAWGLAAPLLVVLGAGTLLSFKGTRFGVALLACAIAQGLAHPMLYQASAAVPLLLGFLLALKQPPDFPRPATA